MFKQVKFILINTTHPGNIGAVARAIKNMGFGQLSLVSPRYFPSEEADARASGAEDILASAEVVSSLEEALVGCQLVMGLSARERRIPWPTLNTRQAALEAVSFLKKLGEKARLALVFGQEQSGLLNEELSKCHYQVKIPADPDFPSLNLGQAVQIVSYELRMAINGYVESRFEEESLEEDASVEAMESFYRHIEETLIKIQFLDPEYPGHLMLYLRRLYTRARVTKTELKILRGILTAMQKGV